MNQKEILALEMRFKSTVLMLEALGMLNGEIDNLITYASQAFDSESYETCKKCLDLVDFAVVNTSKLSVIIQN